MTEQERFDVWTQEGRRIGVATRREVHEQGLWHRTFHCWIYGLDDVGNIYLLFQLRHTDKDTFPGLLDISCAGHLLAGETPEDGVRELEEELGVGVPLSELTPCGVYAEEDVLPNGWIDREFCHVYILQRSQPLTDYRLQREEVAGLFRVRLTGVLRMLDGEAIHTEGVILQPDGTLKDVTRTASAAHFVPHDRAYYTLLLEALAELGVSV